MISHLAFTLFAGLFSSTSLAGGHDGLLREPHDL